MSQAEPLIPNAVPWLVWSNEHRAFWAPNRCGYTGRIERAGRYTKAEAEAICNGANYRANSTIYEGTPPEICMPAPEAVDTLVAGIRAVAGLILDSEGVYGLHLNGDPAPWDELRTGGRFEDWLTDFDCAASAIEARQGGNGEAGAVHESAVANGETPNA